MIRLKADVSPVAREAPRSMRALRLTGEGGAAPATTPERFAVLQDRLQAGDLVAARIVASELRVAAPDDPVLLIEIGRASLIAGSAREAVQDLERARNLSPGLAEAWFLLGLAKSDLGEREAAMAALLEAGRLEPDAPQIQAALASIEARGETGWQAGLARLMALQRENPTDESFRDLLAEAYLDRALRGWTEVETEGGTTVVSAAKKILRLASGADIAPGLYPTTAVQVKTAADCLDRLKALDLSQSAHAADVASLEDVVRVSRSRKYHATWMETGVGVLLVGGFFMTAGQMFPLALFLLACGLGLLVGSFEPQYRANKIILSRRGQTVGDAVIGLAQGHKYGGIAYALLVMGAYPFIAAYKVYMNWGQGWLAKSEIPALGEATAEAPAGPDDADPPATESASTTDVQAPAPLEPTPPPEIASPDIAAREAEGPQVIRMEAVAPPRPLLQPAPASRGVMDRLKKSVDELKSRLERGRRPSPLVLWGAGGAAAAVIAVTTLVALDPFRAGSTQARTVVTAGTALPTVDAVPATPTISGSPQVIDTGNLVVAGVPVRLHGVIGEGGVPAGQMTSFIHEQGGVITCQPLTNGSHRCWTGADESQGYDVAAAAISNGGGRVSPDAPPEYVEMQAAAQAERRGIWQ